MKVTFTLEKTNKSWEWEGETLEVLPDGSFLLDGLKILQLFSYDRLVWVDEVLEHGWVTVK